MVEKTPRRGRALVWATCAMVVGLALVALTAPGAVAGRDAKRSVGTLNVTPGATFVGGQRLTFRGDLGVSGVRRIHLQKNMGRVGDVWSDVEGFSTTTAADGSFQFTYPAPSMFNVRMRVAGPGAVTTPWSFDAKSQDLTLQTARIPGLEANEVLEDLPFTIVVDTTPTLVGRPDLPPPAFPGRTLTLQQRQDNGTWKTLDTTKTSIIGNGAFIQKVGEPGYVTYRVRQEDWTQDGNAIGWYPSFPFTVRVVDPLHPSAGRDKVPTAPSRPFKVTGTPSSRDGQTAAKAHLWGISLWDFAWTSGESLTSRPARGSDRRGWWQDWSDGTGRSAQLNGQISLDSGRNFRGDGDIGTTRATLEGNPATYGRWEAAFRLKRFETGASDYHAVLELVPDRASDYRCGTRNITVADVDAGGHTLDIGVRSASGARWSATRHIDIGQRSAALGIEVAKSHIAWFVDGRTVGVVRDPKAVSGVPMTLRLSLVGDGGKEMNHTQLFSDWERSWTLGGGTQVTRGAPLQRGSYDAAC